MLKFERVRSFAFENAPEPKTLGKKVAAGGAAAIADGYWMLARQWQLGEFRGSSGGSPVRIEVKHSSLELSTPGVSAPPTAPLAAAVEALSLPPAEGSDFDTSARLDWNDRSPPSEPRVDAKFLAAPGCRRWRDDRLEYRIELVRSGLEPGADLAHEQRLVAEGYCGERLDWHHFRIVSEGTAGWLDPDTVAASPGSVMLATSVMFPGMPRARFWEFEDAVVDGRYLSPRRSAFLSLLLMEVGLVYPNDWFIIPIEQRVNTLRKIHHVAVHDVFGGKPTIARPHAGELDFQHFALDYERPKVATGEPKKRASSEYLLLLDATPSVMVGAPIEKVTFHRDEGSNLVWGIEHMAVGRAVASSPHRIDDGARGVAAEERRRYVPVRVPPKNFIPYLPVRPLDGRAEMMLRRGRTSTDSFTPQFESVLLRDATWLHEEEIPLQPMELAQTARLACLSAQTGEEEQPFRYFLWIGRQKGASEYAATPEWSFDSLE
jgi:hypothetical protein